MSPNKTRRALTRIMRATHRKNYWWKAVLAGFKKFEKLQRKRVRHRLATEPQCPTRLVTGRDLTVCQLPNGHAGLRLDLDGRALSSIELTPEMRYELADRLEPGRWFG